MKYMAPILSLFLVLSPLSASSPAADVELVRSEARKLGNGRPTSLIELDRNKDGVIDQAMLLDDKGAKIFEELDFNYDGKMDDFCFYSGGVLVREEIDTNYDGSVDMWVYLRKGIYVERYERDTNFDGVVDKVKKYGPGR